MFLRIFLPVALIALVVPALAFGFGAHEGLSCTGCHGIHTAKGDVIIGVAPNAKAVNPKTKKPFGGITALCIACHETMENGGMGILPVSAAMSHPYNVTPDPKVATVPSMLLRDGKLECSSCHDPHPSNPNFKYLRVDTKGGAVMQGFCGICHGSKTDKKSAPALFDSMDERRTASAPAPAPAPAPAAR